MTEADDPSFDIAATHAEVLIFLASGLAVGSLTLLPDRSSIPGFSEVGFSITLLLLLLSILAGFFTLGRIVYLLRPSAEEEDPSTEDKALRWYSKAQMALYGLALLVLLLPIMVEFLR